MVDPIHLCPSRRALCRGAGPRGPRYWTRPLEGPAGTLCPLSLPHPAEPLHPEAPWGGPISTAPATPAPRLSLWSRVSSATVYSSSLAVSSENSSAAPWSPSW